MDRAPAHRIESAEIKPALEATLDRRCAALRRVHEGTGPALGKSAMQRDPRFAEGEARGERRAIVAEFRVAVPGASSAAAAGGRPRSAHLADLEASYPAPCRSRQTPCPIR